MCNSLFGWIIACFLSVVGSKTGIESSAEAGTQVRRIEPIITDQKIYSSSIQICHLRLISVHKIKGLAGRYRLKIKQAVERRVFEVLRSRDRFVGQFAGVGVDAFS